MIQAYNNIDTSRQKSRQDDIFSRLYPFSATCATCKIHQISKFLVTVSPSKVKTKKSLVETKTIMHPQLLQSPLSTFTPVTSIIIWNKWFRMAGWMLQEHSGKFVNMRHSGTRKFQNSKFDKKNGSFDTPSFYKYQTMRKQVRATLFDPSLLIDRLSMKSDVPMTCLFWRYNKWRNRILDLFSILNNHEKLKSRWAWSCWHPWPQRCNLRAFPGDPQGEPKAVVDKPEDGIDVSDSSVEKIYAYHIKCLP